MKNAKLDDEVAHSASFAGVIGFVALLAFPSPAHAATLLPADGMMGFAGPDACGTAVQGEVAQGYEPPTTAISGKRTGYKKFTLAQLGKVNGLCVTGDTKYKTGVVVYLPPTFEVVVKVNKAGNPVANWWVGMRMGKCDNGISQIWTIDPKPAAVPAAKPAIPAPSASAPASTPCSNCVTSVPKCWTDTDVKAKVCVGSPPDGCGCFIAAKAGTTFRGAYFPDILKSAPCLTAKVALAKKHGWVLTDHQ